MLLNVKSEMLGSAVKILQIFLDNIQFIDFVDEFATSRESVGVQTVNRQLPKE